MKNSVTELVEAVLEIDMATGQQTVKLESGFAIEAVVVAAAVVETAECEETFEFPVASRIHVEFELTE